MHEVILRNFKNKLEMSLNSYKSDSDLTQRYSYYKSLINGNSIEKNKASEIVELCFEDVTLSKEEKENNIKVVLDNQSKFKEILDNTLRVLEGRVSDLSYIKTSEKREEEVLKSNREGR